MCIIHVDVDVDVDFCINIICMFHFNLLAQYLVKHSSDKVTVLSVDNNYYYLDSFARFKLGLLSAIYIESQVGAQFELFNNFFSLSNLIEFKWVYAILHTITI